jgi:hypothetical protein
MALSREIMRKYLPDIPEKMLTCGFIPATMSFYCQNWKEENGESDIRLSSAINSTEQKFKNEFIADVYPLLKEIHVDIRKTLFELTGPKTTNNPENSLGISLYQIFIPFVLKSTDDDGRNCWEFYPSYLKFFIGTYLDKDGTLKTDDVSSYLLTYYSKYESLLSLTLIGEHVKKANRNQTALSNEVEQIFKDHFKKHNQELTKATFMTHTLFQYLLNHDKNSAGKQQLQSLANGADFDAYDSYYCLMLVLIRNIICHPVSELESFKGDLDRIAIPDIVQLHNNLRTSKILQQNLSTALFYLR